MCALFLYAICINVRDEWALSFAHGPLYLLRHVLPPCNMGLSSKEAQSVLALDTLKRDPKFRPYEVVKIYFL